MGCGASAAPTRGGGAGGAKYEQETAIAALEVGVKGKAATSTALVAGSQADAQDGEAGSVSLGGEWQYEASTDVWVSFDAEIGAQLLVAFYCGETQVLYTSGEDVFEVDFGTCCQTNQRTGARHRIAWLGADDDGGWAQQQEADETPWVDYGEDEEEALLAAYAAGEKVVRYTSGGCDYEIDFVQMLQTNLTTGVQAHVKVDMDEPKSAPGAVGGGDAGAHVVWYEYHDHGSGKPYYYNGSVTTWTRPDAPPECIISAAGPAEGATGASHDGGSLAVPTAAPTSAPTSAEPESSAKPSAKKWTLGPERAARDPPPAPAEPYQYGLGASGTEAPAPRGRQQPGPRAGAAAASARPPGAGTAGSATEPKGLYAQSEQARASDASAGAGRPQARLYKTAGGQRPPRRDKKWTLGPDHAPKLAPNAKPMKPPRPPFEREGRRRSDQPASGPAPGAPRPGREQPAALPAGISWPADAKARRVAETLFRDMSTTRKAPLRERQRAYKTACLTWHPDKNKKHEELATEVFKFLQVLKGWYFDE